LFLLPDRPDPLIGTTLGKNYRVLEPIGAGGMAIVYLVEHQTLLKRFAAKVLSNELASSLEARARFTQEAHAASQLDHENIVSISDFGVTVDHRPFFVMELLRGMTLDQRLAEGQMSIEEVVAVSVPVARALAHAHAEGVIHLDVKPENIFLVQRSQGRWGVKVVDFGIAKTPLNPRVTKLGETNGSPLFMAPEMCRGDDDVDQRADVYSFGILLYLMMCGRLPFIDDSMHRVLQMQLIQLPPPPREVNAELSPELAAIVERALAKQREDRYASMDALLADLAAALPTGSDRLLIEAQLGTSASETPFAEAMSIQRQPDSRRGQAIAQPALTPVPAMPTAPKRSRSWLIAAAVIAVAAAGALAWKQLDRAPTASVRGAQAAATPIAALHQADERAPVAEAQAPTVEAIEPGTPGVDPAVDPAADPAVDPAADPAVDPTTAPAVDPATAPAVDPAIELTGAAEPAAPSPGSEPATGAPAEVAAAAAAAPAEPARAEPAKTERFSGGKKPQVRPKTAFRPVAPRPAKRVAAAATTAPAAAPTTAPPATPPTMTVEPTSPPAPAEAAPRPQPDVAASEPAPPTPAPPTPAPPTPAPTPAVLPPAPAPAPAPARPPVPVRPPPGPGSLDALPSVASLEVNGSLSRSIVRRSIDRSLPELRDCYRAAARDGKATPALELQLAFEVDENSLVTRVTATGASFGTLPSCASSVARRIRTQEAPDVGTTQVTTVIRFRPL
jgi:eukaryotic-like serine/threonine-protein kinase